MGILSCRNKRSYFCKFKTWHYSIVYCIEQTTFVGLLRYTILLNLNGTWVCEEKKNQEEIFCQVNKMLLYKCTVILWNEEGAKILVLY